MERHECKNCMEIFVGNFCPQCGQNSHEHRVDAKYFLHDVPHSVFHIDGGFFYTLKMLFTKPGVMIEDFLVGRRARHFRPFGYVMIMTAISAFIVKLLVWAKFKVLLFYRPEIHIEKHEGFFQHYFSVFIFLMIPFASFITWMFFVKKKYNFWEHFLANTYIAAQLTIIWIVSHLISFGVAIFTKQNFEVDFELLFMAFMVAFLYLYGSAFGYLFSKDYKVLKLTIILTIMNSFLFVLYYAAFIVAGLSKY